MAFGSFHRDRADAPVAAINMIPLIDVMLVLLVIFIITAPLLTHAVKIDLPKAASHPNLTKHDNVQLGIRAGGEIYWNGEAVDAAALDQRMAAAGRSDPQPELQIRADGATPYRRVAEVMSLAARSGITKIGFVTDPREDRR
jgi:biopolymer transport protein ExbD